jgi:O-antigen ligase
MAISGMIMAFPLCFRQVKAQRWDLPSIVVAILVFVPWIQLGLGLVSFRGQAWLASGYLLGFLLAIFVGSAWEEKSPAKIADTVFLSIAIAAVASVGLVVGSWLDIVPNGINDLMSMGYYGGRHYANIGQPNLLATFLLWGVLAALWAYTRKYIGCTVALIYCIYLLVGLVLTGSRTGYVAGILVVLIVVFSSGLRSKALRNLVICLAAAYIFLPEIIGFLEINLLQNMQSGDYVRGVSKGEVRLSAWQLFFEAALKQPWLGYGWTEATNAQINVAEAYPNLQGLFGHTHNIALDLIIWVGLPLAMCVIITMTWWAWTTFKSLRNQEDLVIYLALVVFGVHAMLELPHQYASFLIPVGLFIGIISKRTSKGWVFERPRHLILILWLLSSLWLFTTVREYFRIEVSYNILRYERAGLIYPQNDAPKIPDVFYLNQFKSFIELARSRPTANMNEQDLIQRENITRAFPSSGAMFELARAYALNGREAETAFWLKRICPMSSRDECMALKEVWKKLQMQDGNVYRTAWPN